MTPRILYGYIAREFIWIFAAALGGFLLVCLIGDAAERLNKFIDGQAPVELILRFYLNKLPYYIIFILPASSLIATLFTLGQMSKHNELTAMLSSGVSLFRIFLPLLALMLAVSGLSFLVNETVAPKANEKAQDILDYRIQGRTRSQTTLRRDVDYQGENGRRWIAGLFNLDTSTLNAVKLIKFSGPPENLRIDYRIDATSARYKAPDGWSFIKGTMRYFEPGSRSEWVVHFDSLQTIRFTEKPADFVVEAKDPHQMSFTGLKKFIERKKRNGIKIERDQTELWFKTSLPVANFIIVLFGAPLACMRKRIGPGVGIAVSVLVYMLYMGLFYLSRSLGYSGGLSPPAAAWSANLIFALCGVIIFLRVRN